MAPKKDTFRALTVSFNDHKSTIDHSGISSANTDSVRRKELQSWSLQEYRNLLIAILNVDSYQFSTIATFVRDRTSSKCKNKWHGERARMQKAGATFDFKTLLTAAVLEYFDLPAHADKKLVKFALLDTFRNLDFDSNNCSGDAFLHLQTTIFEIFRPYAMHVKELPLNKEVFMRQRFRDGHKLLETIPETRGAHGKPFANKTGDRRIDYPLPSQDQTDGTGSLSPFPFKPQLNSTVARPFNDVLFGLPSAGSSFSAVQSAHSLKGGDRIDNDAERAIEGTQSDYTDGSISSTVLGEITEATPRDFLSPMGQPRPFYASTNHLFDRTDAVGRTMQPKVLSLENIYQTLSSDNILQSTSLFANSTPQLFPVVSPPADVASTVCPRITIQDLNRLNDVANLAFKKSDL